MMKKNKNYCSRSGFTLVELLVTIGLVIVMGTVGLVGISDYRDRQALVSAVHEIVSALRDAQNRSITQAEDLEWGVHFRYTSSSQSGVRGVSATEIFKGNLYSSSVVIRVLALRSVLLFSDLIVDPGCGAGNPIDCNATKEVIFRKLSGFPNAYFSLTIASLKNPARAKRIEISAAGVISAYDVGVVTVSSITPPSGVNVAPVSITQISGSNFQSGASASLRLGASIISGTGFTVFDSTVLTGGTFNILNATTEPWDVVVTNPDNSSGTLPGGFMVSATAPVVTTITPNSGVNSGSVTGVSVGGAYFQNTPTPNVRLTTTSQTIVGSSFSWASSTSFTGGSFNLSGVPTGLWDVVVTNPDTQSGIKQAGFTVTAGGGGPFSSSTYTVASSTSNTSVLALIVPPGGFSASSSVVIATAYYGNTSGFISGITDSASNIYNYHHVKCMDILCVGYLETWSSSNIKALPAGSTITIQWQSAGSQPKAAIAANFTGTAINLNDADQSATGNGTGSGVVTTLSTPLTTQANELVVGTFGIAGPITDSFTAGPTYALIGRAGTTGANSVTANMEYKTVSSVGQYSATGTLGVSRPWAGTVITFK